VSFILPPADTNQITIKESSFLISFIIAGQYSIIFWKSPSPLTNTLSPSFNFNGWDRFSYCGGTKAGESEGCDWDAEDCDWDAEGCDWDRGAELGGRDGEEDNEWGTMEGGWVRGVGLFWEFWDIAEGWGCGQIRGFGLFWELVTATEGEDTSVFCFFFGFDFFVEDCLRLRSFTSGFDVY